MDNHTNFDWSREERTGLPEVVFAAHKSEQQLNDIISACQEKQHRLLITKIREDQKSALAGFPLNHDDLAKTATMFDQPVSDDAPKVAIVTGGTSDLAIARECKVCANYLGLNAKIYSDVGVAGLWRLENIVDELRSYPLLIAIAGMEGAIFSVLAGLVSSAIIAVPTSVGYGVSLGGKVALHSALASCAPGIVTVNIDNGFGAAAAASKILKV